MRWSIGFAGRMVLRWIPASVVPSLPGHFSCPLTWLDPLMSCIRYTPSGFKAR